MKKLTTDAIRRSYLDFFVRKGHAELPSDTLIPRDDPTLLFTGAGMNQFKDMFLGKGSLPHKRATTAQKCLRTGDLDNVGRTPYHHTFFEMMGNFSFGDYFKHEAIRWAFEWLTAEMEIPAEKLYVSVYLDDEEAWGYWAEIWTKAGFDPQERIFRLGAHDNFWPADAPALGPNGPCGPCSEIFYDQGPDGKCANPKCDITCECRRYVEIWNLVFTQYDRQGVNVLNPLPQKNIDTGLGLERMAAVMQGVRSNFETDIFAPIIAAILKRFCGGADIESLDPVRRQCVRRIADHVRAFTFAVNDGARPGNAERGYVVRRLVRRAYLDASFLVGNFETIGLHDIVPAVVEAMHVGYPDVARRAFFVQEILRREQEDFARTLSANQKRLLDAYEAAPVVDGTRTVNGEVAFKLFDTYGVPVEVMEDFFERANCRVDRVRFDELVEERRKMSRAASKMKGDIFDLGPLGRAFDITTASEFLGPDDLSADKLHPLMIFRDDEPVLSIAKGDHVVLVLDRTPFYGESGGQVGDRGELWGEGGLRIRIDKTTRIKKVFFHLGEVLEGSLTGHMHGDRIVFDTHLMALVDEDTRRATERNHTATHLLQWALREVLGRHCEQSGSLVEPDRLRFDFTHFTPVTADEIAKVERLVNGRIVEDSPLVFYTDTLENARKSGVTALFGEKYEERVRVVDIGGYSKELCGGCHVRRTGEIGSLTIVAEEAVAAGIRRITALTGLGAAEHVRTGLDQLHDVCELLGVRPDESAQRVGTLIEEGRAVRLEAKRLRETILVAKAEGAKPEDFGGVPVLALELEGAEGDVMRSVMDRLKSRVRGGAMLLAGVTEGSVALLLYIDDDLVKKGWKAGEMIKPVAAAVGGSGGGRPNLAQAGGKNPGGVPQAMAEFRKAVEQKMKREEKS